MKIFLLDLWHDLRAKRMWPVAVGLALALVAVPVVLSKSSETPAAAPAKASRKAPDPKDLKALASVKLTEADESRGSSLDTFDPSNPFRPPKAIEKRTREGAGGDSTVTSGAGAGNDGGSTGDSGGSTGGGDTGSTGGGDTGSTGGGDTGSASGGNAVFLVDSTLDAAGEGRCKPRASECAFLYIGAGSEHEFTNEEGASYTLRIDEIRKVRVGASAAASRRGKTARAAVGSPLASRRFLSPLADVVTVSNGSDTNSN